MKWHIENVVLLKKAWLEFTCWKRLYTVWVHSEAALPYYIGIILCVKFTRIPQPAQLACMEILQPSSSTARHSRHPNGIWHSVVRHKCLANPKTDYLRKLNKWLVGKVFYVFLMAICHQHRDEAIVKTSWGKSPEALQSAGTFTSIIVS